MAGTRSKSAMTASEPGLLEEGKNKKNKKMKSDTADANSESNSEENIATTKDKKLKRKMKNKAQPTKASTAKKNKKIIFNDDDGEPVEVDNTTMRRKQTNQDEPRQENEDDIKDEDIDKFCDELDEEHNEQFENWVKLVEAKLKNFNKSKPK
ncbi:hypothetical protein PYW07_005296 [Mythimna separata]|uniref:Uncharacterized protein n=1 Tax=Mythimna separata TaxID=271217 RepID=A0AAD7YE35_MYTSE|nr:hypothetical protein PYW07_005296 [Mythimna separata]